MNELTKKQTLLSNIIFNNRCRSLAVSKENLKLTCDTVIAIPYHTYPVYIYCSNADDLTSDWAATYGIIVYDIFIEPVDFIEVSSEYQWEQHKNYINIGGIALLDFSSDHIDFAGFFEHRETDGIKWLQKHE